MKLGVAYCILFATAHAFIAPPKYSRRSGVSINVKSDENKSDSLDRDAFDMIKKVDKPKGFAKKKEESIAPKSEDITKDYSVIKAVKEIESIQQQEQEIKNEVTVRFVNYSTDKKETKSKIVPAGTNLLNLADELAVTIPRNCRTGLCGSCTADLEDPNWTEGERPGYQTIRLCSAGAMILPGCSEMVIDCFRNNEFTTVDGEKVADGKTTKLGKKAVPMDRFGDDWEADFVPDFKSGGSGLRAAAAGSTPSARTQLNVTPAQSFVKSTGSTAPVFGAASSSSGAAAVPLKQKQQQQPIKKAYTTTNLSAPKQQQQQQQQQQQKSSQLQYRPKKQNIKKRQWTMNDITRKLGNWKPEDAEGVAPWDTIW